MILKMYHYEATQTKKNIDFDEINKFDTIADSWWDRDGQCQSLHRINPLRLDYILNRAGGLFGKKVLDVGCGGGLLTESMAREGAEVVGLDISSKSLAVARLHALQSDLTIVYIQETVEAHIEKNANTYEVITCMEILEHVPNPSSIVGACACLAKPDGAVFFSTINRTLKALLMAIIGAEYIIDLVPRGTHEFNKFIKPAELLHWIDSTTLYAYNMVGLKYNFLRDKFYLSDNVDVNYLLHTRQQK